MEYNNLFKPPRNLSEEAKKKFADNILTAFEYVNVQFNKHKGRIIAIEFEGKIIFENKENENENKIQKER